MLENIFTIPTNSDDREKCIAFFSEQEEKLRRRQEKNMKILAKSKLIDEKGHIIKYTAANEITNNTRLRRFSTYLLCATAGFALGTSIVAIDTNIPKNPITIQELKDKEQMAKKLQSSYLSLPPTKDEKINVATGPAFLSKQQATLDAYILLQNNIQQTLQSPAYQYEVKSYQKQLDDAKTPANILGIATGILLLSTIGTYQTHRHIRNNAMSAQSNYFIIQTALYSITNQKAVLEQQK